MRKEIRKMKVSDSELRPGERKGGQGEVRTTAVRLVQRKQHRLEQNKVTKRD
jgi:hypothetical protein